MIQLNLPTKMCNDCPNFKAEVCTEEMFEGYYKKANHYITCKNSHLCSELIKSIEKRKEN